MHSMSACSESCACFVTRSMSSLLALHPGGTNLDSSNKFS